MTLLRSAGFVVLGFAIAFTITALTFLITLPLYVGFPVFVFGVIPPLPALVCIGANLFVGHYFLHQTGRALRYSFYASAATLSALSSFVFLLILFLAFMSGG